MEADATPQMGASDSLSVEDRIESIISPSESPIAETKAEPANEADISDVADDVEVEAKATSEDQSSDTEDIVEYDAEEVASLFGIDPDSLSVNEDGSVSFKTKVNGEEGTATLKDLIKGHQLEQNVNRKSMELSEALKQFEQQKIEQFQALNAQFNQAQQLTQYAESQLLQEFNNVDWNALRNTDPAEYAAMQRDYETKYQQIQGMKQNLQLQQQQTNQQLMQQQQQWLAREVQEQQKVLLNKVPEWKDQATAKKEAVAIEKYLMETIGLSEQETNALYDHRHIQIARDAMLYRQMMGKTKPDEKKVNRKLRVNKSSVNISKQDANKSNQAKRRAVLKKSGSVEAMASVLADMI